MSEVANTSLDIVGTVRNPVLGEVVKRLFGTEENMRNEENSVAHGVARIRACNGVTQAVREDTRLTVANRRR